ncbi:putative laccase-9 [Platanthera guangdongensis]|uniref:Laccase n=1 Tax=Platanthera guangdongensis TaxID=2320717 RepID=A0ABR2MH54_9ASPA
MRFAGFVLLFGLLTCQAWADISMHDFIIQETSYTRLCLTKKILTVNGKFPGETIYARKGDTVIVRVHNQAENNVTIHWHGLSQPRNPWSDGPEYITQCPIQPGANFTYRLFFSEEEGTIWWHAHSSWDRATVHGAIVVNPRIGTAFPYPNPYKEIPIILGEWWIPQVSDVIAESIQTGAGANISDAYTINGQPGDLYPCSNQSTFTAQVEYGKTYLLRIINAAITSELFFAIAGHRLTVVGTDASYTKPYSTDFIMITPGQTFDVLVEANSTAGGRYYMAARSYSSTVGIPFDNTTTTAILEYVSNRSGIGSPNAPPAFPSLPDFKNTDAAAQFTAGLRSLASEAHPVNVPQVVDQHILITVSVNLLPCGPGQNCSGPNGDRLSASLNNQTFNTPTTDVLEAYYKNISGVFGTGFPGQPPLFFNFTGENLPGFLLFPNRATEVRVVEYNTSLEIVFQGTNLLARENHPMHLHGFSFYVVGTGFGNFDKDKDPLNYNLVDPPYQNTVGVPRSGWAAIRFKAQNPGVWFMHCHLDQHLVWGMDTVFIVKNGNGVGASLLAPPPDMPPC